MSSVDLEDPDTQAAVTGAATAVDPVLGAGVATGFALYDAGKQISDWFSGSDSLQDWIAAYTNFKMGGGPDPGQSPSPFLDRAFLDRVLAQQHPATSGGGFNFDDLIQTANDALPVSYQQATQQKPVGPITAGAFRNLSNGFFPSAPILSFSSGGGGSVGDSERFTMATNVTPSSSSANVVAIGIAAIGVGVLGFILYKKRRKARS